MQDGIGHHLLTAVVVQNSISLFVGECILQVEVAPQLQSLTLQQVLQRHLSPVALQLVAAAHHIGQSRGSLVDARGLFAHCLQLFGERRRLAGRLAVGGANGLLQLFQVLAKRCRERLHRLGVLRLQLVRRLIEYLCGEVLKLLLHRTQLLLELLLSQLRGLRVLLALGLHLRL